jgi:carbon storage regulator
MVLLTRKENETIKIGDKIKITVVRIKGGAVQLGVEAPESFSISRERQHKQGSRRNNYLML